MPKSKPLTLADLDDTQLAARKADAQKLDNRVRAQFSLKGLLGWVAGAAAIAGTLAFFGLPLLAVVLPVAAAIAVVPPAASFAATFYTTAELKRITDMITERAAPKSNIEVVFEDGTKSVVSKSPARALSEGFTASASAGIDALSPPVEAPKPQLLLPSPAKITPAG